MSSLARSAAWYARRGWRVFPCVPGRKEPAIKAWHKLATTNLHQIETWWRVRPDSNIGVACGPESGLFVIDVDQHGGGHDGEATLAASCRKLGDLPVTVEQRTGSGGRHLFFAYPEDHDMRNKAGPTGIGLGVDTRGNGGAVVVPPSLHPCGDIYRWNIGPHQAELAALPTAWVKALERQPPPPRISVPVTPLRYASDTQDIGSLLAFVAKQCDGNRNNSLYWATRKIEQLKRLGLIASDRDSELLAAAIAAGLATNEARATIASAKRAEDLQ